MTKLAVVSYPTLSESDHVWIDSWRTRRDPQASRIGVHFTLVFPIELAAGLLVEHTAAILEHTSVISFVLRRAEPVPDPLAGGGHVFLVPEEGRGEITALHDRLYGGLLRPFLRADLPFLPHLTIGASPDVGRCQELAAEVNRTDLRIQGAIQGVDVIEIRSEGVRLVTRLALEQGAPQADT